jgi:succinate dehydrogenase / fumarate reductase, cytochrome b subunit
MARPRPKYLNLVQIRLPVPGLVSIMHRVSGAALFLFIPFLLTLFEMSLESAQSYARFKGVFSHWVVKLIVIGLVWAYLHHLFAGVRHLALDLHYGSDLAPARATSWAVIAAALVLTAAFGVAIW